MDVSATALLILWCRESVVRCGTATERDGQSDRALILGRVKGVLVGWKVVGEMMVGWESEINDYY